MSILIRIAVTTILVYHVSCEKINCATAKTCGDCVGRSISCVWCDKVDHTEPRCQIKDKVNSTWCSGRAQNPNSEPQVTRTKDSPITAIPPVVQLRPQAIDLSIRPGQTKEFKFTYKPAKDYPLDVYYLMDFSYTMNKAINLLKSQAELIYKELNHRTNNVRLGLGSFVEKAALPFANPNGKDAYAFKHHLSLTTNTSSFLTLLTNFTTGANYDDPEATLDALMQAMVCKDEIGWRNRSRKIIVVCTDSTYHSAGDGKIAGAAKLNDMKCHLDDDGTYNLELEQDYPSVNQIRKIVEENNIIIIFNVRKRAKTEYVNLINTIQNGAEYVELKEHSDIVKTITDVYTKKLNKLHMTVAAPPYVRVKLTPDCTIDETCQVKHQQSITVTVSITVDESAEKENPACSNKDNTVIIKPVELGETLKVNIRTICKCDCEDRKTPNAKQCSSNGTLECGVCRCNANRFGEKCNCDGTSSTTNMNKCKANAADLITCSGHGSCSCDECICDQDYSGQFCEFHDKSCPKDQESGIMCAGNGYCKLGRCNCYHPSDWTGIACQCPVSENVCRAPYSGQICSGHGRCDCGRCVCTDVDSTNKTYFGDFCEYCSDCDGIRCKELEDYVQCVYPNETKKAACDEKYNSTNTVLSYVNKTEMNAPEYHLAKRCETTWNGKVLVFKHKYDRKNGELHIIIQKELEEPDRTNFWIAIGSSVGGILLIGIFSVILWKILVDMYDAREYKKFNKMLDEAGDIENINTIYKPPTVNFTNPLFNRKSRIYN